MMKISSIKWTGLILAVPAVLWLAGEVFGFGKGFSGPSIPQGAHLTAPASKGVLTYELDSSDAKWKISFDGQCGEIDVTTEKIDVTALTEASAFATATGKQIDKALEGTFVPFVPALEPFGSCYGVGFQGVYVTTVVRSLSKTATKWTGEAVLQGVVF